MYDQEPKFRIFKSLMAETPVYQPMFTRTLQSEILDSGVATELYDLSEQNAINTTSMARLASKIIRPSGAYSSEVSIDNGFNERRILFMIGVEITTHTSRVPRLVILNGYTDYLDVSYKGLLPPSMRFYIDSVTTINQSGSQARVTDASHVISPNILENLGVNTGGYGNGYVNEELRFIRPQDILMDVSTHDYSTDRDIHRSANTSARVSRSRNQKTRRRNGMASSYLADLLKPAISAESVDLFSDGDTSRYDRARVAVSEPTISGDYLLRHLKQFPTFQDGGYLEWQELERIFPNIEAMSKLAVMSNDPKLQHHQGRADNSNSMSAATMEAVTASIINSSMGAILSSCLITSVDIEFSNETIDGSGTFSINPETLTVFDQRMVNPAEQVRQLEYLILHELLPILTFDNEYTVLVRCIYDIQIDSYINVSWCGGPGEEFVTPTFCDSLFTPVLTTSAESVDAFSNNTKHLVEAVLYQNPTFETGAHYDDY